MAELREITQDEFKNILEAHRKWVETWMKEEREGKRADLQKANLSGAYLEGANLQEADLRGANLRRAYLQRANFQGADLEAASLQGAFLGSANLQGANLFLVRGLNVPQVSQAENWELAFYDDDFLKKLALPPDHNKTLKKKLAELEKEKKEAATKK